MLRKAAVDALKQVGVLIEILRRQPDGVGGNLFSEVRIGAHIRHVHDHFKALFEGLESGTVNYNKRNRGSRLEADIALCEHEHQVVVALMSSVTLTHSTLFIISEIDCFVSVDTKLTSTIERELLYLINHTIHHVAIIKLMLEYHGIEVPVYLGTAPSTSSYQRSLNEFSRICAQ